jgi:phosphate transport system protein
MFKNIMQFWNGKDFLKEVLDEFRKMLNEAEEMYSLVCRQVIKQENIDDLEGKIYKLDKMINEQERDIRKRIVEHLSMNPSVDVPVSLILMSVVKDAERLGDYAKNLFQVNKLLKKPIDISLYSKYFNGVETEIINLFKQTETAFLESDEAKATDTWNKERDIVKRCDAAIEQLAISDVSVNEAVCFTLIARHFKRIAAHLTNIATSVILPISDLDYFDEKRREGKSEK